MKNIFKDKTTKLYAIYILGWSVAFLLGIYYLITRNSAEPIITTNSHAVKDTQNIQMSELQHTTWLNNKEINQDYVAQIEFDSGLLNLPVVQAYNNLKNRNGDYYVFYSESGTFVNSSNAETDGCDGVACNGNDVYIKLNWETMKYDQWGSNFIDYRNSIDDQNIIIYGHHSSRIYFGDQEAEKLQFTKLDYLLDEKNYEENKNFSLILGDEIRAYEVAYVLKIDVTNQNNLNVYRTGINTNLGGIEEGDFYDEYMQILKDNSLYDTGKTIERNDKFVTISTCIQGMPDLREIVIAKEIDRGKYNNG